MGAKSSRPICGKTWMRCCFCDDDVVDGEVNEESHVVKAVHNVEVGGWVGHSSRRNHTNSMPNKTYLKEPDDLHAANLIRPGALGQFLVQRQHPAVLSVGLQLPAHEGEPPDDEQREEAALCVCVCWFCHVCV